jgi:hypothetical protein
MWIADNLWEEGEDGRVHYVPGRHPLDVDKGIVEQAKLLGIHIIRKAELNNISTRLLNWACLIKVHHRSDGDTLPTAPSGEFQDMLTEFQGFFRDPTYANWHKERQTDFEIKMDPNGQIPFRSLYRISPRKNEEHWR